MRRWQVILIGGSLVLVLAACGSSTKTAAGTAPSTTAAAMASQCTSGTGLMRTASTASYTMVLNVNPSEAMYTPAQVAAQHPMSGEVMLRGQMNTMAGDGTGDSTATTMKGTATTTAGSPMTTSPMGHAPMTTTTSATGETSSTQMGAGMGGVDVRHVEVHICSRSTGKVIQNAQPSMTVVDHASAGMTDHMSVAEMQGIGSGVADMHYGNNIVMPVMHHYTVTVTLNGEHGVFDFTRSS